MKAQVQLLLTVQLVLMLIYLGLVTGLGFGDFFSALTGCMASLIPSAYFSFKMLRSRLDTDASEWLAYAYRSDIGKWIMAAMIFALAFSSGYQWDPMILFIGYLLVQMAGMFVPLLQKG